MTNIIFQETIEPTVLKRVVAFLHNEKIRFEIQDIKPTDVDWLGDFSTYQMAIPTLSRDWDAAGDAIWDGI